MALSFALVHWSAAAGPAASSKQAETADTTANRRVTGLAMPDTYGPATRQVNQKFGILLEARRSRSAGRQVVDAELDGDDGAREAHHRRLPVDFEERGRLPVGKALADEQRQADGASPNSWPPWRCRRRLDGDDGAQRDIEGRQQDVGDRASQRVRPPASRVRHARRGESDQEDPYRIHLARIRMTQPSLSIGRQE